MVSAYHTAYNVEHGREAHPTYRHRFNEADLWHIDFCFVPASWRERLMNAELLDGPEWAKESDHHPLVVDVRLA